MENPAESAGFSQRVKKLVFDTLTDCKEGRKTSNSHSSAYRGTVEGELRSKSKFLRKQALFCLNSSENSRIENGRYTDCLFNLFLLILTVSDFFDSLKEASDIFRCFFFYTEISVKPQGRTVCTRNSPLNRNLAKRFIGSPCQGSCHAYGVTEG